MAGASARAIKAADAYVSIFADASELWRGLKQIEGKIKRFGDGLANAGAGVATIGAGIAGIGAAGLSALAWPLKLAANMENAEAAFTTLLKDEGKAKKLLGELEGFAASTPFQFDELADASKKLLAFGSAAGNVETELRSIGDIASAIGAPIGEITEIYGKARVQGRLFAEDINQLTGRGIPIIQELAKQFGVTEQEVKKLVESGQVNFGNLEKAFQSLTSGAGQFAGGMERQSKTLTGSFSTLKDNIVAAFRPFGKELLPAASKALQLASSAVQEFSKWAKQNAGLSVPLAAASIAMLGIGAAAAVAGFATVFLGTAISAVGTVAGGMAAAVALVGGSTVLLPIAAVTAGVLLVGAGIAYVIYQSGLLTPAIAFIGESFQRVFGVAKETIGGVTAALSSGEWGKAAQIAWTGIKLATLVGAQQVLKGIDALWNNAGKITWSFLESLGKTIFKVFASLPKIAWSALRGGASLQAAIGGALAGAFTGDNLNLAGNLDASIAGAQQQLNRLTAQQQGQGVRGVGQGNSFQQQQGQGVQAVSQGNSFQQQQGMAGIVNARNQFRQSMQAVQQQSPFAQRQGQGQGQGMAGLSNSWDQLQQARQALEQQVQAARNRLPTPNSMAQLQVAAGFANQQMQASAPINQNQGGGGQLGQLLQVAQGQLFALRRLVEMGGLD